MITELYNVFLRCGGISTDSRTVKKGELFFALQGEHYDANLFVPVALKKGCAYVVCSDRSYLDHQKVMVVEDVLLTLQELARHHRTIWNGEVLAITGSNGKTTTKELVAAVLSRKYKVHYTLGNLNNHIGVPLTILRISTEEMAVIEMGANHPGEIALLCDIAAPDTGIITNIGKAHLDGFGSLDGVEKAKGELYDYLLAHGGTALVNVSEERLVGMARSRKLKYYSYGLEADSEISGQMEKSADGVSGAFKSDSRIFELKSQLFGEYNFMNMLSAAAAGMFYGVDPKEISDAVYKYIPDNNRSQILKGKTNTLILDAYNANPSSMTSALMEFLLKDADKKMVILGDMYELGSATVSEHEKILQMLAESALRDVFLVGSYFSLFSDDVRFPFRFFQKIEDCMKYISENLPDDYLILLKGSRKNSLEEATNLLLNC